MNKRKSLLFALIAAVLALVCELLLFNFKPLTSMGRTWLPLTAPVISDDLAEGQTLTLAYYGLDWQVRQCHVAVSVWDKDGNTVGTTLVILYSDDGNRDAYRAGSVRYTLKHDNASYFCINSYGNVHSLIFRVETLDPGCTWKLEAAEINGSIPFHISVPRIGCIFAVLMLFWFLRPASVLHDNRFWNRRRWIKGVCVALVLLLNAGVIFGLACSNEKYLHLTDDDDPGYRHHSQYAKLARALSEGRTWIDTPADAETVRLLSELKNPYDNLNRYELYRHDITPPWDVAYHGDHLYVYFGVVPVLLGYLPFYLITGEDLPTIYLVIAIFILILAAAFACMRALIRRFFPTTPFPVYLLLSVLLGNCTGVLCYALDPNFYIVPIYFALAFSLFALAFWLSAAARWEKTLTPSAELADPDTLCFAPVCAAPRPAGICLRIALGSLMAALVAGCRPQFLVFTALALPILGPFIRRESRRAVTLRRMALFALPYLAVAIPLMYYNYVRFGSPFDFGANYNLTTNDMTLRGIKPDRLPDGLFAYLFAMPNLKLKFPYLHWADTTTLYIGRSIVEPMFGGAMIIFPFLWMIYRVRSAWDLLREKKLRLFFLLPILLGVIVIMADTEMAGILWRYTGDFLVLLYLSAILVYCAMLEKAEPPRRGRLLVFLTAATLLSLLSCLLISFGNSDISNRAPEFFFHAKDFMSFG